MPVPFLDLSSQYQSIRAEVEEAMEDVFRSQRFILGPEVEAFERELAAYCGADYGIGVSSGTDALLVSLMSAGIGAGDEVITSSFSFFATAGAISRVGATPVFVDIDPATFNLDPALVAPAVTPRTRALIPVHLFGQMADLQPLQKLAERHALVVIEDACQSLGARSQEGPAGSLGHYGCFSFFPSKNLGGAGDAGMVVCRDRERAERLRQLRSHGATPKYYHPLVGGNFRLDALQAAVLRVKLRYLDAWTARRQANAARYRELFRERCDVAESAPAPLHRTSVMLPYEAPGRRHVYHQFVIRVRGRDALREHLTRRGIGHEVYYPLPLHLQPCFLTLGYREDRLPCSERAAAEVIALPIYPELSEDQQCEVVDAVVEWLHSA